MTFTAQQKAIAIAPKFTSVLSMCGSSFIIYEVIATRKRRAHSTHNRLLLGMSICDLVVSTTFFFTTWPIPSETVWVYGASGNMATCIAQGFFSQFSIAVVMYNTMLALYYLIKIRYQWNQAIIHKRVEPFMHAWALLFGIVTATAGVVLDLYNNDSWECWISPLPLDCHESWKNNGKTNCVRGDNASAFRWIFYYAPLWCAIAFVTVAMYLVYRSVLTTEKKMDRFTEGTGYSQRHRKHSKKVANQGYWYCGAFYLTWLFPTITRLTQLIAGTTPYPLILVTAMFVPIQGFFNAIVYIHPRYKEIRLYLPATSSETSSGALRYFSNKVSRNRESEGEPASHPVSELHVEETRSESGVVEGNDDEHPALQSNVEETKSPIGDIEGRATDNS